MAITTRAIAMMTLEQVELRLQELGWKPNPGVKLTLLEKKSVLRELLEKLPVAHQTPDKQSGHRNLAKKNKEELKHICLELQIPLTGNETKPQLTRKIKEKQTPTPEVLADDTIADFGKYRGRTYEWIWSNDLSYCLWATDTVVEEGERCSASLRKLAEYIEHRRQGTPEGGASASTSAAPASRPATLSMQRAEEDPEAEIERLQKQMDELKSQLSNRRRKKTTTPLDTNMPNAGD